MRSPYTYTHRWTNVTSIKDSFSIQWSPSSPGEKLVSLGVFFSAEVTYTLDYSNDSSMIKTFCGSGTEAFALIGGVEKMSGPTINSSWSYSIQPNTKFSGETTYGGETNNTIYVDATINPFNLQCNIEVTGSLNGDMYSDLKEGKMSVVITFNTENSAVHVPSPPTNVRR